MIVIPVQSAAELLPPEHTPAAAVITPAPAATTSHRPSTSHSRSPSLTPDYDAAATTMVPPVFGKLSKDIARDFGRLYEAVAGARRIIVVCGAGISVSAPANIPDFRSSSGLFQKLKDQHPNAGLTSGKDLFDARLFNSEKTSDLFYTMIAELKEMSDRAQPTAFHHFLKRLDVEGRLLRVYTQNIDGLEERAGLTFGLKANSPAEQSSTALGKRKRAENKDCSHLSAETDTSLSMAKRAAWARSQSDSAVLWAQRAAGKPAIDKSQMPMFPRTIPLHGSLNSMTCGRCGHQEMLENAFKTVAESLAEYEAWRLQEAQDLSTDTSMDDATAPASSAATSQSTTVTSKRDSRRVVPELKRLDIHEVLTSLRAGEHIPCPRCETADEVRLAAGLRSRGVGRMKPDVVLYGGQNDGAERVGECLSRDILGLRDPNETLVPETLSEIRARERRLIKEGDAGISLEVGQGLGQEDTLGSMFFADDEPMASPGVAEEDSDKLAPLLTEALTSGPVPALGDRVSKLVKTASKSKARPKLKPLPPDLLIVAGTSLKVSGTKRIIREFAKACHARDARYYPGDDDSEEAGSSTDVDSTPRRRRGQRKRSATVDGDEEEERAGDSDEEDDPKGPIRTILLNYEFPAPSSQWEDVFDIWIQGDVQAAARGLWPMPDTDSALGALPLSEDDDQATKVAACLAGVNPSESWAHLKEHLEEQRALEKKYKSKSAASIKRRAREEEETMPPKLMALSLSTLAALPMGAAQPVPLPQLGRKRSFVKAKTLSSLQSGGIWDGGPGRFASASASASSSGSSSLSPPPSPDCSLLERVTPAKEVKMASISPSKTQTKQKDNGKKVTPLSSPLKKAKATSVSPSKTQTKQKDVKKAKAASVSPSKTQMMEKDNGKKKATSSSSPLKKAKAAV
ncbi:unnamed protein product [Tilletia controversa]|uniref:Deacetylase sirtuin-type domain-containing protein n=1 Tax=Tilletia controversa TaxID=13291 RepID=A0A8X7T0K2_9BASI|nr:hypothetical protein CF328_g583 [Tilletia controversa]KAE8255022.1 hypothetical protein A4X06_0g640 [Tilletia controversa]CAD6896930.1 unnamed protein product [Tilletia controversa]CAD6911309.1 unnamed protein product [Tilletia controversa]CAD6945906.1 unnamed protein product [Tilletia controversa]